jgi:hypothetical protein
MQPLIFIGRLKPGCRRSSYVSGLLKKDHRASSMCVTLGVFAGRPES